MAISRTTDNTIAICDTCSAQFVSNIANGVIPATWMTGQLWLDISLAEQRQTPICFCPDCKPFVADTLAFEITVTAPAELDPDPV